MGYYVTQSDIDAIINSRDAILEHVRSSVEKYPQVAEECVLLDAMRESDPKHHAQRAFLFAITSPQTTFDKNVRAAIRMHEHLYEVFPSDVSVQDVLEGWGDDGYMGALGQSRYIHHSLQAIRALRGRDCNAVNLWLLRDAREILGMGAKTIAMASALYDADAPVYTLDRWMLRGLLGLSGLVHDAGSEITISRKRYGILEAFMLGIVGELGFRPFVAQWAQWNDFRNGTHESHYPIFA